MHCFSKQHHILKIIFLLLVGHAIQSSGQRIAVIGGGVSGTFVSKYLVDLDQDCSLDALTIYDPLPLGRPILKDKTPNDDVAQQGSRVGTFQMEDGRIIELGASIFSDKFKYIMEMAEAGNLTMGKPFDTGVVDEHMRSGMAVFNGNGDVALNTANITDPFWKKFALVWRYNIDLVIVTRAVNDALSKFEDLQSMLQISNEHFFESPKAMWQAVGLDHHVEVSLDEFCDKTLWVPNYVPWWRRWISGQGSLRQELLSAINLVNYNQDNSQINALAGLASFSVASAKIYGIRGGNYQIVATAFDQAVRNRQTKCPDKPNVVSHSQQRISTVIGSLHGFELFAEDGTVIGEYDTVVLAAPYSMAGIDFLVKSHVDESVLQPMALGGLVESQEDGPIPDDHEGHIQLPKDIPVGVRRPYTQVVTTVVRGAELQTEYFSMSPDLLPRGIYMTPTGKATEYNITAIAQIASDDGLYKIFSSQPLGKDILETLFGPAVSVEYEKNWGGRKGGATPDFATLRSTGSPHGTPFLLYDGATGFHGHTKGGALYYPNSLELTFACIELSAMGSKAVAKLIAKRFGWVDEQGEGFSAGSEL
jgi:prenylcysteine oxidase/farnesylcysteine lyase